MIADTRVTRLRLKLLEIGGPQYLVAARAGFSPSRMSEYALGKPIPPKHLMALCAVLKCTPDEIQGWA